MNSATVQKSATYAYIEALPPGVVGEILFGRLARPFDAITFSLAALWDDPKSQPSPTSPSN